MEAAIRWESEWAWVVGSGEKEADFLSPDRALHFHFVLYPSKYVADYASNESPIKEPLYTNYSKGPGALFFSQLFMQFNI